MTDEPESYDVVVAGGGPAGSAAALVLARAGRRVLLVERAEAAAFRVGEALPPAARPLLRDLGVLEPFLADGHLPCYANLSSWGGTELHATDFIFDRNGHGWHLDRPRFDARLRSAAAAAGAELRVGGRLARVVRGPGGGWRLVLAAPGGEAEVAGRWLVDATGRRARVARGEGSRHLPDDDLIAFFALFRSSGGADHDSRTLIEAVPDGWWYTALLPSGRRVAAFLTDADLAPRTLLTPGGFTAALAGTEHLRARLSAGAYEMEAPPRGTAARSARLERFHGDGWLAAGDAALSFDPLSSQGILTALYTGLRAGEALHRHLAGDPAALHAYAERLTAVYDAYLRNRSAHYALEGRWPDRPFWRRRAEAGPTPP